MSKFKIVETLLVYRPWVAIISNNCHRFNRVLFSEFFDDIFFDGLEADFAAILIGYFKKS